MLREKEKVERLLNFFWGLLRVYVEVKSLYVSKRSLEKQ